MIETRFDEADLKQFLLLWYDYNVFNKGVKKKIIHIHKAIKYLLIFEGNTDFSKEKNDIIEHYSEWRAHMRSISEYCAREAFKEFQKNNMLPENSNIFYIWS